MRELEKLFFPPNIMSLAIAICMLTVVLLISLPNGFSSASRMMNLQHAGQVGAGEALSDVCMYVAVFCWCVEVVMLL